MVQLLAVSHFSLIGSLALTDFFCASSRRLTYLGTHRRNQSELSSQSMKSGSPPSPPACPLPRAASPSNVPTGTASHALTRPGQREKPLSPHISSRSSVSNEQQENEDTSLAALQPPSLCTASPSPLKSQVPLTLLMRSNSMQRREHPPRLPAISISKPSMVTSTGWPTLLPTAASRC